ncbi:MAG: YigZ family protein [Mucinivorans sp.]
MDCYKSISSTAVGAVNEKGSRFLSYAFVVSAVGEVKPLVDNLRREHHAARHCAYAYRIGAGGEFSRANDDGEPSGTAGRPILGQILARDLSDVLVVVVRYFGGTLRGGPGLIAADKGAAVDALGTAQVVEKIVEIEFQVTTPYALLDRVLRLSGQSSARVVDMGSQAELCVLKIVVRRSQYEILRQAIDRVLSR